jgi:hypothetical protein
MIVKNPNYGVSDMVSNCDASKYGYRVSKITE